MTTAEIQIPPLEDISKRAELLTACVGGAEAFTALEAEFEISSCLTQIEKIAIATVIFRLDAEEPDRNNSRPNPYEVIRGDVLLASHSLQPNQRDIAMYGLLQRVKALPKTQRAVQILNATKC